MNTGIARNDLAVFALTAGGAGLAERLAAGLGARIYLPARLKPPGGDRKNRENIFYFNRFQQTVSAVFHRCRGLVFIMATGIVVRTVAPLLTSKYSDPAVVVVDEAGRFAISLVSGHVGGANNLAGQVAGITGGTPVITTATDVMGKPAVDVLAGQLDCVPFPKCRVKEINRALVEGETVWLTSRWPVPGDLVVGFEIGDPCSSGKWKVVIDRETRTEQERTIFLLPRNLVVGIGCRRGVTEKLVAEAVEKVLEDSVCCGKMRLKALATVDVKKDEEGIRAAARNFGLPLKIVSRAEIKELAVDYEQSDFVKKILGVGGVCEPAAVIASNRGRVVVPKRKMGPLTVAVAEEKLWWWDWDPGTGIV